MADDSFGAVVLTPPGVSPEGRLLAGVDTTKAPRFSVGEVAKVFFGRSPHLVRLWEYTGRVPVATRDNSGVRRFTLTDMEELVFRLLDSEALDGESAAASLAVVYAVARVYGYLPVQEADG